MTLLETYISTFWHEKTDKQLANELNIKQGRVGYLRRKLKLLRIPGAARKTVWKGIVFDNNFIIMCIENGLYATDIARQMGVSRQRLHQLCKRYNIVIPKQKNAAWLAKRYNTSVLGDRALFINELFSAGSLTAVAKRYNVSQTWCSRQAKLLDIPVTAFVAFNKRVFLYCHMCGTGLVRKKSTTRRHSHTFCSTSCRSKFKWLSKKDKPCIIND